MNVEAIRRQVPRDKWPECARPVPDAYPQWTAVLWPAFWDLTSCRHFTDYSVGQIPWTAIDAWLRSKGFDGDAEVRDVLAYAIRRMDAAWLKAEHERMAAEMERAKGGR